MKKTTWVLGVLLALAIGCDDGGDGDGGSVIRLDGTVGMGGQGGGAGGQGGGAGGQGGGAGGQGGGQGGEGGGAGGQGGGQGGEGGGAGATEDTDALCSDMIDNDEDGDVDCEDFDCARNDAVSVCTPVCEPDCAGKVCGSDGCDGECGPGCGGAEVCADGQCLADGCPDGTFECDGNCSRLTDDPDNCGSCGAACDRRPNALRQCIAAECYLNCPGMEGQPRSIDFDNDPRNCGRCGTVCPSAAGGEAQCRGGVCQNPCPNGQSPCDGRCVNLERDEDNCGGCGRTCNDGMQCTGGACACADGSVDVQTDPRNCGSCGNICSFPAFAGGQAVCERGECAIDCDDLAVCAAECANLQTDVDHCGACDSACPGDAELPQGNPEVAIRDQGCDGAHCTYVFQRTTQLNRGDNECDYVCAHRGMVCDNRVQQIRTCMTAAGRVYEMANAQPGVGCFMFYSDREREYRFEVAPSCDANLWDYGFTNPQGFSYNRNAVNCNCIVPGAVEPEPEPDPMPEPMPEPEPDVGPRPDLEIIAPGTYNRPALARGETDSVTLVWPNASEITVKTRGPNNGECPDDTTLGVFRGGDRIAYNDDADDVLCSSVTLNVQGGERLRIDIDGYQGAAVPAFSIVVTGDVGEPPPPGAGGLLISEYVEGGGANKALEIYNAGAAGVDLADCTIERYSNGGEDPLSIRLDAGQLAARGTFVLCGNNIVSGACQQRTGSLNHNGDDTLALACNGTILDVFGRIGEDPGLGWGAGAFTTNDHTLRRKCAIEEGDPNGRDAFDPSVQWDSFPIDTLDGLGSHCR